MSSLSTTDIVDHLGAFAETHLLDIMQREYYNPFENDDTTCWSAFGRMEVIDGKVTSPEMEIDLKVKRTSHTWGAQTDAINFDGRSTMVRDFETDLEIPVDYINRTYLAHLRQVSRVQRKQVTFDDLPLGQFLLDSLTKAFMEGMFLGASFEGVFNAAATYTDSWAGAFNGVNKIIGDAITAGKITNVVATGPITTADAFADLEEMGRAVPARMFYKDLFMLLGLNPYDFYNIDYKTQFPGANPLIYPKYNVQRLQARPKTMLVPTPENSTDAICITPKGNICTVMNFGSNDASYGGLVVPSMRFSVINPKMIGVNIKGANAIHIKQYADIITNDQYPA